MIVQDPTTPAVGVTAPAAPAALVIDSLCVDLDPRRAGRPILDQVSLTVARGETVGLVGESGSGKSVTSRCALGMIPGGATVSGRVEVNGIDVLSAGRSELRALRRGKVSMIFQDPRAGINPVRTIADFLSETMRLAGTPRAQLRTGQTQLLESVGIHDPVSVLDRYPHQLSGGMLQRVMIASALAADPALLLADEPTTALDVTIQAEVIAILQRRREQVGAAMLFITHDLELAAAICDRIYVMYAGRIVEEQSAAALFANPQHPYTRALLAATPRLESSEAVYAIGGRPPSLAESISGCPFFARCPSRRDRCADWEPRLLPAASGRAACLLHEHDLKAGSDE